MLRADGRSEDDAYDEAEELIDKLMEDRFYKHLRAVGHPEAQIVKLESEYIG